MSTDDVSGVTRSQIVSVVSEAEDAERLGEFEKATAAYRRAIRLVQQRYQAVGRSPVSLHEMKERHAATAQGLRSEAVQNGGTK